MLQIIGQAIHGSLIVTSDNPSIRAQAEAEADNKRQKLPTSFDGFLSWSLFKY